MTAHMRLRTRMVLWFTASVAVIMAVFFLAVYAVTGAYLDGRLREDLSLALEQLAAQVEHENDRLIYEDETPIAPGVAYFIMEENGSEMISRGEDIALFDGVPLSPGCFTKTRVAGMPWLLLDSSRLEIAGEGVLIRVAASCEESRRILGVLRGIFAFSVPFMTMLAAALGLLMANRSLRPVRQITACANRIASGAISLRIPPAPAKDELGELTDTLNAMLSALEESFARERRFTSDASHELRTPVAVVLAYAEGLLAQQGLTGEQRESAKTILHEAQRMEKMIAQMLMLARAQEGRQPVIRESFALRSVFEGVCEALEEPMREKRITCQCDVPPEILLFADQSLITRLVLNLVENAVKYGKPGGTIRCGAREDARGTVFFVQDDGIGIAQEDLPHVFERFFRADSARDRSGTGLGLSIAKWIADVHGAALDVKSAPGRGTIFTVTLPRKPEKEEKPDFAGQS